MLRGKRKKRALLVCLGFAFWVIWGCQIGWFFIKSSHRSGNRDIGVNGLLFCFCLSVGFSACVYFLEHTASRHFEGHIRQSFRAIDQATYVYDHNRSLVSGHVLLTVLGFFFFCYPYLLHHFAVRGSIFIFLGACEVLRLWMVIGFGVWCSIYLREGERRCIFRPKIPTDCKLFRQIRGFHRRLTTPLDTFPLRREEMRWAILSRGLAKRGDEGKWVRGYEWRVRDHGTFAQARAITLVNGT